MEKLNKNKIQNIKMKNNINSIPDPFSQHSTPPKNHPIHPPSNSETTSNINEQKFKYVNKNENIKSIHNTSQNHKTPMSKYSINPNDIPRPCQEDEIYLNNEKKPYYETNIGSVPPHSTSYFHVKETQNSSCKFIRPTLNKIPLSQSLLNEASLSFGICVQPFYQISEYEKEIPKVDQGENFFRCEKCKSYINNKYNLTLSKLNTKIAVCNLCHHENILNINIPGVKNEYLDDINNISCPELIIPSIDFIAPKKFRSKKIFLPHYLFMIDISESSYQLGLPFYVINSIQNNLNSIHNSNNSYIAFALYDISKIYFFYVENNDIRMNIMADIKDPFCPLSLSKLYIKIENNENIINKLIDKLNSFIEEKNKNKAQIKEISTITGCAIKSGVDSLLENGGRVMIFTSNPCYHGYGGTINREKYFKINEKNPKKLNPFYPQNDIFAKLGQQAAYNKIVIDQFIFLCDSYDLSTFSTASNLSGGEIFNYSNLNKYDSLDFQYQKLYYDISRVLTRPNYYNCKFMLRCSKGLECYEILGPFNKKYGNGFELGGCDPDYCFCYNMRLTNNFKLGENIDIQIVVFYENNFSETYVRIFNYTFNISNEISIIYGFSDVDAIIKNLIYKEISLIYNNDILSIINNLEEKIINSFTYYRLKVKKASRSDQLILPLGIKYLPLYINSFFKMGILSSNIKNETINSILYITYKLLREPVCSTMKLLYPKFFRIDDVEYSQYDEYDETISIDNIGLFNEKINSMQKPLLLRLSKDVIDFDCAYLLDDGNIIYIFIFNQIKGNFYKDLFGVETFEEAKNMGINCLNEENQNDLNQRILKIISQLRKENGGKIQPLKLFFFDEKDIYNPILTYLLKEDNIGKFGNYPEYLCKLHQKIQEKMEEY